MNFVVARRKIKSNIEKVSGKTNGRFSLLIGSLSFLVFVLLVFCVVELSIVSVLSPGGKVLRELNYEKEQLIEENRKIEQEIAERAALGVITNRAEKDLDMKRAGSVDYLELPSVSAEVPSSQ